MKINKKTIKTKQLLQFHILKSRIYDKKLNNSNSLDYLTNMNISKLILKLKKSIEIIFKFHKQKKKILFIGIPKLIENKINLETNHIAIPKFYNIFGLFINKSVLKSLRLKYQILKKSKKINFSKLINKPDLIVIFNSEFKNNKRNLFHSYEIPGNFNFNKKSIDNLFFKVINSILNK